MPSMAETSPEDTLREARLAVAADLLVEHKAVRAETLERLRRTERHLVISSRRAGMSARRIAEILGTSRGPVDAIVAEAKMTGDLPSDLDE